MQKGPIAGPSSLGGGRGDGGRLLLVVVPLLLLLLLLVLTGSQVSQRAAREELLVVVVAAEQRRHQLLLLLLKGMLVGRMLVVVVVMLVVLVVRGRRRRPQLGSSHVLVSRCSRCRRGHVEKWVLVGVVRDRPLRRVVVLVVGLLDAIVDGDGPAWAVSVLAAAPIGDILVVVAPDFVVTVTVKDEGRAATLGGHKGDGGHDVVVVGLRLKFCLFSVSSQDT